MASNSSRERVVSPLISIPSGLNSLMIGPERTHLGLLGLGIELFPFVCRFDYYDHLTIIIETHKRHVKRNYDQMTKKNTARKIIPLAVLSKAPSLTLIWTDSRLTNPVRKVLRPAREP